MSLDEELHNMDLVGVKKYKADETFKAVLSGGASFLGLTTLPGVIVGGIGGGFLGGIGGLVLGLAAGKMGAAGAMCLIGATYCAIPGAWIGGAVAYVGGWAYTGVKVYNTYQAHKREIELEYGKKQRD